jgi:hypothetical protein
LLLPRPLCDVEGKTATIRCMAEEIQTFGFVVWAK